MWEWGGQGLVPQPKQLETHLQLMNSGTNPDKDWIYIQDWYRKVGFLTSINTVTSETFSTFSNCTNWSVQNTALQPSLIYASVVICPFCYYIHESWTPAPNSKTFHGP